VSDDAPTAAVRSAFDAIAAATASLRAAIGASDAEAVERALAERGRAIRQLEEPLRRMLERSDGRPTAGLAREREALEREAGTALAELRDLRESLRGAVEQGQRDATAIRAYRPGSLPAAVLERLG
jgi:ATP phosphoribosyltransferase regulatory subunit HisZ